MSRPWRCACLIFSARNGMATIVLHFPPPFLPAVFPIAVSLAERSSQGHLSTSKVFPHGPAPFGTFPAYASMLAPCRPRPTRGLIHRSRVRRRKEDDRAAPGDRTSRAFHRAELIRRGAQSSPSTGQAESRSTSGGGTVVCLAPIDYSGR
jgi:hypothetical protein